MQYVHALLTDLRQDLTLFLPRKVQSIFIGGGTPSLFSAAAYDQLLTEIGKLLPFDPDIEITLEANPGTIEQGRFTDYRHLGINRLSLGIQSFNPKHLQKLGRIHDEKQAHKAIECARKAGFDNVNLDLMHNLPDQTIAESMEDLRQAFSHQVEHISWYQLTIEPNTVFYKTQPVLPSEEVMQGLEEAGLLQLDNHHFDRYEISAFARHNKQSKHNLNYWLFGDYLGIGAGAHGKLTTPDMKKIVRTRKHRLPTEYLNQNKPHLANLTELKHHEVVFEFMLNTTRLQQPIENALFTKRTGLPFGQLEPLLQQAVNQKLIQRSDSHWQVTDLGRRFTNNLQAIFLQD